MRNLYFTGPDSCFVEGVYTEIRVDAYDTDDFVASYDWQVIPPAAGILQAGPASASALFCASSKGATAEDAFIRVNTWDNYGQVSSTYKLPIIHLIETDSDSCLHKCLVGGADGSGVTEIADGVYLIDFIFEPGSPPPTPDPIGSGDPDCSGVVEIADAVFII
jgi:hypothetical protein